MRTPEKIMIFVTVSEATHEVKLKVSGQTGAAPNTINLK